MFGFFSKKKKATEPAAKKKKKAAPTKPASDKAEPKPTPEVSSLQAAIAALEETAPVSAGEPLERAKDALAKRPAVPADRQKLIAQALAIQQVQSRMLDNLPAETRKKLTELALKTFAVGDPPDKKNQH